MMICLLLVEQSLDEMALTAKFICFKIFPGVVLSVSVVLSGRVSRWVILNLAFKEIRGHKGKQQKIWILANRV